MDLYGLLPGFHFKTSKWPQLLGFLAHVRIVIFLCVVEVAAHLENGAYFAEKKNKQKFKIIQISFK